MAVLYTQPTTRPPSTSHTKLSWERISSATAIRDAHLVYWVGSIIGGAVAGCVYSALYLSEVR